MASVDLMEMREESRGARLLQSSDHGAGVDSRRWTHPSTRSPDARSRRALPTRAPDARSNSARFFAVPRHVGDIAQAGPKRGKL